MTTSTSEPGTRLGGRYRLEDRVAAGAGWAAWKAIDEILARAVTVFTFAPGFPRVDDVVTAARAASRLTDPRLAQVFDVEDDREQAYVVMEWATGETLSDLLSDGPLEPSRGALMIAEAAGALTIAHAAGVAHMCLSPGSLRWSGTGEVKIIGLGIYAALIGAAADDPVLADTEGLGRLLYAALTGHWPGPEYDPALPPAPTSGGLPCSPRQVRAGVPATLSDLTCKAMQLRTKDHGEPVRTPDQLARALLAAATPEPFLDQPMAARTGQHPGQFDGAWDGRRYQEAAYPAAGERADHEYGGGDYQAADYAAGEYAVGDHPAGPGSYPDGNGYGEPRRHGRRGARPPRRRSRSKIVTVAAAAVALLAVGSALAFSQLHGHGHPTPARHRGHSASPSSAPLAVLQPQSASGFDPLNLADSGNENSQTAKYAIDGSTATAWESQWYNSANLGGLKAGSGLIVDMGHTVTFRSVNVLFGPFRGCNVRLLVSATGTRSPATLTAAKTVARRDNVAGQQLFTFPAATGRYLIIWFTRLAPHAGPNGSKFAAEIFNIVAKGR